MDSEHEQLEKSDAMQPQGAPSVFPEEEIAKKDTGGTPSSAKHILWELSKILILALLIVLPIRLFVMQPFFVRGASMEPTYLDGDYLIIDELSYRLGVPQRGDVIVFRYPLQPSQFFIKRIVGLPGETVSLGVDGRLLVYSDEYSNDAVFDESTGRAGGFFEPGTVELGSHEYYVLGDNREASSDSRRWGALPENFIIGRAWLRLWPLDRFDVLTNQE